MEDFALTSPEAKIIAITFGLATREEICKSSVSECPISHASQLSNPFLGLPLETGKCESCGTGEVGQCEGHFGYIELPTPIYHPDHVGELKRMLSLLCLKCLRFKNRKTKIIGVMERMTACCEEVSQISVNEAKTSDGAYHLELNVPPRTRLPEGFWDFLQKYGFRYGDMYTHSRPLLPSEVMAILRKLPKETVKKLSAKVFFPQEGYILQHLPVPPNSLSVPDVSDGISTMSTDHSIALLKKVLRVVEIIKNSRSGKPNFESQEIESNDLQAAVTHYLEFRGTGKATRDVDNRFGVNKEINASSTKAWLEKMKTLFIRKGSGFSSRSVITGDPFKGVSEIGLPFEIAQKITFEERVNQHNMEFLQKLVDKNMCLAYRDGVSTYSLREGSKGHTFLRPGQVVHRRIMDGDIVFINRPPTTHKHSLQALSVYVHDDHTVKINPLICGPLSADFDGDCIHLFYPQSLEAKAEVVELFAVEKQLLSSHTGNFNLQLSTDSLLSLKTIFRRYFLSKAEAQQLAMFVPHMLPKPAVLKSKSGPLWTASQVLQMTLPHAFDCSGERHVISNTEVLSLDFNRDVMTPISNDIVTSLFFMKGPNEVLRFFNSIQPLLMDSIYSNGFSVSLRDFCLPRDVLESIQENIQKISPLLYHLRSCYSESIALQLDSYLRSVKIPVTNFILKSSRIGHLIDSKSESALNKVVQQIGFLGIQLSDKGKFYSEMLVKEMSLMFQQRYPSCDDYPAEEFGLVGKTLFRGLDPYQEMVHAISSREIIVRSTRGLTEPGTLFKNLMAILRDVVICYDGTVRNTSSNSIIQFEYGVNSANTASEFCAGDPVGVLAATAMSNPAYKAVLDSSASSNSSWEMMKEILLCGVTFKSDISDRRVRLYLNNCDCGRKHCQESAALVVQNHLKKVTLKDTAIEFLIEYSSQMVRETHEVNPGPVGHIHLNKTQLVQSNISMHDIYEKCEETINLYRNKKKVGGMFRNVLVTFSECCSFCQSSKSKWIDVPCIQFLWREAKVDLERASQLLDEKVCPVLLETIIKGDDRVASANIVWLSPDKATWGMSPSKGPKGELALDIILKKEAVQKTGDAWRVLMDSCLPIIHLIDTKRSIPYAIKQVQELLGISCAFEQAVQRLSTSVTMVTKGVLKDHLLLLANSMTCAGTFIGFNTGGIKSLSKSLGVQVPFMNATLYTPRKCFERAAEKRHVDNLSSIVASCAWGKHVTVGTGSPFEILWDTRKAELCTNKEIDAYSFLHLVSSGSNPEDIGTSCLGAEIDDLDQNDYMDFELSPVRESGLDKPTFEDGVELGLNGDENDGFPKEDGWLSVGTTAEEGSDWGKKADSDGGGAWGKKAEESTWSKAGGQSTNAEEGSAWGKKADSDGGAWGKKAEESTWSKTGGKSTNAEEGSAWGKKAADSDEGGSWGKKAEENTWSKTGRESTDAQETQAGSAWGKKTDSDGGGTWGKKAEESTWSKTGGKSTNAEEGSAWGKKAADSDGGSWGKKAEENTWSKTGRESTNAQETQAGSVWGKKTDTDGGVAWGKKPEEESTWGAKANSNGSDWTKISEKSTEAQNTSVWGKKVDSDGVGASKKPEQSTWGSIPNSKETGVEQYGKEAQNSSAWGKKADSDGGAWGKNNNEQNEWASPSSTKRESLPNRASASGGKDWGTSANAGDSSGGGWDKKAEQSTWGQQKANPSGDDWAKKADSVGGGDWANKKDDQNNWANNDGERPQWSRGRGRGRGRGWVGRGGRHGDGQQGRGPPGDGDWKDKRPRPTDDPNALGLFTMTRQRLDTFTVEEQDVLAETEAVMKVIRRVMHQTGCKDGDPLPADDQKYIIDNVLNYHPDKAVKMGSGIDHIMVSRHGEFQDSRCFFAVTVDGGKTDFSYRKCLENFIKEKHADKAETFIPKYWRKIQSQPRSGWNKDRGPPRGDAGTPTGWNRASSTPVPDEAGTPGRAGNSGWAGILGAVGAETPGWAGASGWNKDQTTPGTDEAATASVWEKEPGRAGASGWNKDQTTPGPDEAATASVWEKEPGPVTGLDETQPPTDN
ncbi:hypothetical protein CASFOL_034036 [Castilleja foliolosa]|uniref:DNA-directed RNA polymerase subunit n=1 Tax=Castilleja foliolosa TaxID=1961234 RepID=A0ABD3BYP1_9LAMI